MNAHLAVIVMEVMMYAVVALGDFTLIQIIAHLAINHAYNAPLKQNVKFAAMDID